jgi:hypothetical protein
MTYSALVTAFTNHRNLPISPNLIIDWVIENTGFDEVILYGTIVPKKSFWGTFRVVWLPGPGMYSHDPICTARISFDTELDSGHRRLVVTKELTHVFDSPHSAVDTGEKLRELLNDLLFTKMSSGGGEFARWDSNGLLRAFPLLFPRAIRHELTAELEAGRQSYRAIANIVDIPVEFVQFWIENGDEVERKLCPGLFD